MTVTTSVRRDTGRRQHHVPYGAGFWIVAAAFAVLMAFGTAPSPLWPLYQARDGFDSTTITVIFAMMVVGAGIGFLFLGHLSDRYGRRRVVAPALVVGIAATVVMVAWPTLAGLLIGRFLIGLAVGLMAATATTYLTDLYRAAHPGMAPSGVPGVVSTAANLGGLALGPLVAGVLAQWAPYPLVTPYLVFAGLLLASLVLILVSPETVDLVRVAQARPARFALRPGQLRAFLGASAVGFFSFALFGMFSSLGSIIIRGELAVTSPVVWGVAASMAFAVSAVAQLGLARLSTRSLVIIGVSIFPTGLVLVSVAMYHPSLWLYLVGAGICGAGGGMLFKGGLTISAMVAEPASRAGVLAVFFVVGYLGMGLPSILLAGVAQVISVKPALVAFAVTLSVGAAAAVGLALGPRPRTAV